MKGMADKRRVIDVAAPVAGFALLAIGLTWPLALHLGDRFAGNRPLDIWVHAWSLWWVRFALGTLRTSPFETHWLFYPDGVALYLHTLTPLAGLLAAPVGWLWGATVAYNVTAIAALALAGLATYRLARRWTSPAGAALAGVAFAAAPWVLHQLRVGHLNLMNAGWLPLAILLLLRASDSGRWRDGLLAVVGLAAAALVELQFVLFLAVAGAVVLVERLATAGSWRQAARRGRTLGLIAVGFGLLLLPLAVAATRQGATVTAADLTKYRAEQTEYAADLAAYTVPQLLHPLWGRQVSAWLVEHPLGAPTEGRVGLGLTVLVLAAVALAARRPGVGLWGGIGLAGLLLSLGPWPQVGGVVLGAPGPFALLADAPLVSLMRTPARFAVLVALATAVLAGIGLAVVMAAARRRWGSRAAGATAIGLSALLLFEALPTPFPSTAPLPPDLAEQIAAVAGDGAVLELPYLADDSPRMFFQLLHQRPITSGYIARQMPKLFLARTPVIADLMWSGDGPDIVPTPDALGVLATYRFQAIVVYRPPYYRPDDDRPAPSEATLRRRVQALLGVAGPDWQNDTGALYRVPPAAPVPVLALAGGWHAPETRPDGPERWMTAAADLRLDRPAVAPATLTFSAHAFARPRQVAVLADDRPLTTLTITVAPGTHTIALPAAAGTTRLTLRSLDGADAPAALGQGADPRLLSIAVSQVQVMAGA
ncbi:MAG: hypothetical protein IT340_00555 [Chloroflexi bacterium]|nr:hypothetical protein [Chloroflexota bacterium]